MLRKTEVHQVTFQGQEVEELVKTMVETSLDYKALGVSLVKGSLNSSRQHLQGEEEAVLQLGHLSMFLQVQ